MPKTLPGTLLALAAMGLVSPQLEGTRLAGAWAGLLSGLVVGFGVVAWQKSALRRNPARAMDTMALGFLFKLVVLASMGAMVLWWEPMASRLDAKAFLLSAALGMVLLLTLGALDNAAVLRESAARAFQPNPERGPGASVSEGKSSS
ncbi:MAG: hypothetical protein H6830_03295 [Planctomycetes bacterium]|nr:hypothetical protein [Planctomycetota bacterium]MCB9910682.1 hypothetical protein [Planctomycetota bacterium]